MKKKLLLGILGLTVLLVISGVTTLAFAPPRIQYALEGEDYCAQYNVKFDASSIEAIYLHPEEILQDVDAFWAEDGAYRVISMAPAQLGYLPPSEEWAGRLEKIAALSPERRQRQQAFRIARELMAGSETFCEKAIPHVLSFLPEETDLDTTIYLTALSRAYAPNVHHMGAMAVDVSYSFHIPLTGLLFLPGQVLRHPGDPWADLAAKGSASTIFNTLVHELFHVGYWNSTPTETQTMLASLQNEGLAVYVAYKAETMFPAPLENDPRDKGSSVRELLAKLNELFAEAESMPADEFMKKQVDVGFRQKAFHIVGAAMAHTIDEKLGRDVLIETITEGPQAFVRAYNSVAEEDMQVRAPAQ